MIYCIQASQIFINTSRHKRIYLVQGTIIFCVYIRKIILPLSPYLFILLKKKVLEQTVSALDMKRRKLKVK